MDVARQVLDAISGKIRDVMRLMEIDIEMHLRDCASKLDSCVSNLISLRGIIEDQQFASVEGAIRDLQCELNKAEEVTNSTYTTAYHVPRPSVGVYMPAVILLKSKFAHRPFALFAFSAISLMIMEDDHSCSRPSSSRALVVVGLLLTVTHHFFD
jgi:hypothetical protein